MLTTPDTHLLTRLQAGDEAAFEAIFLAHYGRIYGLLYRLLGNRADAEDVAQQVFLKLYQAPERIKAQNGHNDPNLVGWLYRVATNTGYNRLRGQKRYRHWTERFKQLWSPHSHPITPAEAAEVADERERVQLVLGQLNPRTAKLLLLRHSGLSYQELAATLNVAPGSIGSMLTRAERKFRQQYQRTFPESVSPQEINND